MECFLKAFVAMLVVILILAFITKGIYKNDCKKLGGLYTEGKCIEYKEMSTHTIPKHFKGKPL